MFRSLLPKLRWLAICGLLVPSAARADEAITFQSMASNSGAAGEVVPVSAEEAVGPTASESAMALLDQDQADEGGIQQTSAIESAAVSGYKSSSYGTTGSDPYCCSGRGCMPFVGVATTFLAPVHNTTNGGSLSFTDAATGTTTFNTNNAGGMVAGPRLWAGLMGPNGWGMVVRYWRWTDVTGGVSPFAAGGVTPTTFNQSSLQLQTLDVEGIRLLHNSNYNPIWVSFGYRYAQFQNFNNLSVSQSVAPGNFFSGSSNSGTDFYGSGITGGLFGKHQINCGPWSLFYGGRASMLWSGNSRTSAQTSVAGVAGGAAGAISAGASTSGTGDLFIGEAQLGLQYDRCLKCLPINAFFRVAAEYQYWNVNAGGSASANSLVLIPGNLAGRASASSGGTTLDLLGFNVATGFYW